VYQDILMQFIAMLDEDERFIWFQQDGAESGDYPRDCSNHPRNAEKSDCQYDTTGKIVHSRAWNALSDIFVNNDHILLLYSQINRFKNAY